MKPIFRTILPLFLLAALFGAGCSDDAPLAVDPTQPTPAPGTLSEVTIGCRSGISAEVRTSLGGRDETAVEVRWTTDDTFRLAAREQGAGDWLFNDASFALQFYSSEWNIANFVGQVDVSLFSLEKKYDYIAFSPQPTEINGAQATFTIPAEQTGDNFAAISHLDIMSASLTAAQPLQAGLAKPAINLAFTHHTHILEFTIPKNNLGEAIRYVKLTFPQPVTGQMTVDALNRTASLTNGSQGGGQRTHNQLFHPEERG